ncbi:DUF4231 domain-containing protein [Vibrio anguillarum]|uniref:DUF4231 domain-containing protein n=3 Tax=Vibrio anguillarum TaxID=55601 RepID=UPI001F29AF0B|nr:DUF4231 domain-containing protein [Vibrio anguillarum]
MKVAKNFFVRFNSRKIYIVKQSKNSIIIRVIPCYLNMRTKVSTEREQPINFIEGWIEHFSKKSSHNKSESLTCFRLIMICSISAPMFISLADTYAFSKVTPSVLSGVAAFCTAWLQLRKPQILWSKYKTAQRALEAVKAQYQFELDDFSTLCDLDRDKLLVSKTIDVVNKANESWASHIAQYDASS